MRLHQLTWIYIFVLVAIIVSADGDWFSSVFGLVHAVPFGDKVGHFFLIGFLAFLVNLSLGASTIGVGRIQVLRGNLYVMVPVLLEEISQIAFPSRTFDLLDLAADAAGVLIFGRLVCLTMALYASRAQVSLEN